MTVTRIGRNKHRAGVGRIRPLIVNVIVYADDIDVFLVPAQLRRRSARQHIASIKLTLMVSLGCGRILWAWFLRNDVNHRIDVADLNVAADLSHRLNCGNTRLHLRRSEGEAGKARHKFRAEDVDVVGPAVMPEIPDHLSSCLASSLDDWLRARKVVDAWVLFDQMPAEAFPNSIDSALLQLPIIAQRKLVVPGAVHEVESLTTP